MKFGIMASGQMPEGLPDPGVFREIAAAAEGLGYDSLWCGDHLSFGNAVLEATVAVSAFAGYTSTITIGTGVLLLPLRPAALVAKQMATLDYLCGSRLICGLGVGGDSQKDFDMVSVPLRERGARIEEGIRVLRTLWAGAEASFSGRFSEFTEVTLDPPPTRPGGPPIWVGARAGAALARAGRLTDGWMGYMVSPNRYAKNLAKVRGHAIAAGRDPDAVTPALMIPTRVGHDGAEARAGLRLHLSKRYHTEFSSGFVDAVCLAGSPDEVSRRVEEYSAAGVRHLIFLYGGRPEEAVDQFTMLHETVVAPRVSPGAT